MSRKTKKSKSYALGILPNGQVVRVDTLLGWDETRRAGARGYQPGQVVHQEPDTDYSRDHRNEAALKALGFEFKMEQQ